MTSTVTILSPVPTTQTDTLNPKVRDLVERYKVFAKKSAENIIQLAKTLVEAQGQLDPSDLTAFCSEVGIHQKSATYRKLIRIAENADRFNDHLDRMPTAWTTVYNLAKLPDRDFEKVVSDENFSPTMTAKGINKIVGKATKHKVNSDNAPKVNRSPKPEIEVTTTPSPANEPIEAITAVSLTSELPLTSPRTISLNLDGVKESDIVAIVSQLEIMRSKRNFTFELSNGIRTVLANNSPSTSSKRPFQMEQAA